MSPFALNLEKTRVETRLVTVQPAINAFNSMVLISKGKDDPGFHEWVPKTREQMSAEELARHNLVTIGFHYAILPQSNDISFEAYMDELEAAPPSVLRERLLDAYGKVCMTDECKKEKNKPVKWDDVLSSAESYVAFLKHRFGEEWIDVEMESRAWQYVIDPAALKQLVTGHIRWFWKNYLQTEWERVLPMLEKTAKAFNKIDMSDMTRPEIVQFVTGKELQGMKWSGEVEAAREVFFERHGARPCPALDPRTGSCELYDARPLTCRTYGPPVHIGGESLPPCRLCFVGATPRAIARCRVTIDAEELEDRLLRRLFRSGEPAAAETVVAFALEDA